MGASGHGVRAAADRARHDCARLDADLRGTESGRHDRHEFGIVEALIKKQDKVPPGSIKRAQDRIEELQENNA